MTRTPSTPSTRYVLALGVALVTVAFLLLGIGALGIVGDGDRDALYLAAPAVAVGLIVTDRESASIVDVVMLTAMYAGLFAVGAWLFTRVRASGA